MSACEGVLVYLDGENKNGKQVWRDVWRKLKIWEYEKASVFIVMKGRSYTGLFLFILRDMLQKNTY